MIWLNLASHGEAKGATLNCERGQLRKYDYSNDVLCIRRFALFFSQMLVGYLVGFLSFVLLHMYAPFEHSLNARIDMKISESWSREGFRESNKACSSKEFLSFQIKRTQCILSLSVPQPQLTNRLGPSNMCIAHWTQKAG